MKKISAMYEWSGDTDYRHTCYECKNCIRQQDGKRISYVCSVYQKIFGSKEKWKEYNIACKHFWEAVRRPGDPEESEAAAGRRSDNRADEYF